MFVLPPEAGGGVLLFGDQTQDAEGFEIVRQRRGGAAGEVVNVDAHDVGPFNRFADSLSRR